MKNNLLLDKKKCYKYVRRNAHYIVIIIELRFFFIFVISVIDVNSFFVPFDLILINVDQYKVR